MQSFDFIDIYEFLQSQDITEPVIIEKHGKKHAVMIPYEVYKAMHKSNREALLTSELSEEDLDAINNSKPPKSHDRYNDEVE